MSISIFSFLSMFLQKVSNEQKLHLSFSFLCHKAESKRITQQKHQLSLKTWKDFYLVCS